MACNLGPTFGPRRSERQKRRYEGVSGPEALPALLGSFARVFRGGSRATETAEDRASPLKRRSVLLVTLALLGALACAAPASAHKGEKAEARIAASVAAGGLVRVLNVRLTDLDDGNPVSGATVVASAEMASPHVMRLAPWSLAESARGLYRARVRFAMAARWTVSIGVSGRRVVAASAQLPVAIRRETSATRCCGCMGWPRWAGSSACSSCRLRCRCVARARRRPPNRARTRARKPRQSTSLGPACTRGWWG